jgi:hypothetical protein
VPRFVIQIDDGAIATVRGRVGSHSGPIKAQWIVAITEGKPRFLTARCGLCWARCVRNTKAIEMAERLIPEHEWSERFSWSANENGGCYCWRIP